MKSFLIIAALVIGAAIFAMYGLEQGQSGGLVRLHAGPGNSTVQMFRSMTSETILRTFPDGAQCTYVEGPWKTSETGITMSFYKLTCDNTTGWINAKWVR